MKQLSTWARNHKWYARIIIIISWILLTTLAVFVGGSLTERGIIFPTVSLVVFIIVFLAALAFYPSRLYKKNYTASAFYVRHKTCDLLLAVCSFCLVLYVTNKPETLFQQFSSLSAASIESVIAKDSSIKTYKSIEAFSASMKDADGKMLKWKERKKLLKQQVKAIKKSPDMSNSEKTVLTIVAVLVALGLLYLVAALACNLSCNGSEAAAVIVGIGGAGLVVFLLILALRGIYGKKKKRKIIDNNSGNPETNQPPV